VKYIFQFSYEFEEKYDPDFFMKVKKLVRKMSRSYFTRKSKF